MPLTKILETRNRSQSKKQKPKWHWSTFTASPLLVVLAIGSLTATSGQRFYNQPRLDEGTIAPQTIEAPMDATVPDAKTTEEKRKAARLGEVKVLKTQEAIDRKIAAELETLLEVGDEIRREIAPFPFADRGVLSTATQGYLRRASQQEWEKILQMVNLQVEQNLPLFELNKIQDKQNVQALGEIAPESRTVEIIPIPIPETPIEIEEEQEEEQPSIDAREQRAISELVAYRKKVSAREYGELIEGVLEARESYAIAWEMLVSQPEIEGNFVYDASFLELSEEAWEETKIGIETVAERMLAQGISAHFPRENWARAVKLQVRGAVSLEAEPLAIKILQLSLQANLVPDPEATKKLAELAAQKVQTVEYSVRAGEIIVSKGQRINRKAFVLLDHFQLSRREIDWRGLIQLSCLVTGAVGMVLLVESRFNGNLRKRDHILLLLLTLTTPVLLTFKIPWTSLPAVGLLAGSFYGSPVGVTVVGLLSALVPFGVEVERIHWLASLAGGLVASLVASRLRSREELALLGVGVGLTQGAVYFLFSLIVSPTAGIIWYSALGLAALEAMLGLAWSVVALGLSPYLEHLFDLITPIRLAELANPNRPLLKRLVSEAPGTFQHTMFVTSLAEAAARVLQCNVDLVRTGTLYHDIGKMHDPLGFIENQMGGPNKHDEINDPWVSLDIIKKHVTQGLVMARKHRLPKAIRAFIPEHQGTMSIAYFYYQAKQIAEKEGTTVSEDDFRYDGPIPQSRETGIVMLADSCEAALRSLKDAGREEALQMVNKILKARWMDNQLVESGIQKEEMPKIAETFVQVWAQYNHKRIAYPKGALKE